MSGKCGFRSKNITSKQTKIECNGCNVWFHSVYVDLSRENEIRQCVKCAKDKHISIQAESKLTKRDPKLTDVITLLQAMRLENKEFFLHFYLH